MASRVPKVTDMGLAGLALVGSGRGQLREGTEAPLQPHRASRKQTSPEKTGGRTVSCTFRLELR